MESFQDYQAIVNQQQNYFYSGKTRSLKFRKQQLQTLKKMIVENETIILEAIHIDLNKPDFENKLTETQIVLWEIDFVLTNLEEWMHEEQVITPLFHKPASSLILPEPLGTTLIIAPWNYPFQLLIAPLVASISAGNTTVLKPSEVSSHTASMVSKLIPKYFPNEYIAVIEGGVSATTELLKYKWDLIFYTGSTQVGKIIMTAAAQHLTPVVLELGGKSPCIVDQNTKLKQTARKIAWGKFLNAGQTCIAPDYILVHKSIKDKLVDELKKAIDDFYSKEPEKSADYARIINESHFKRLVGYLSNSSILYGGKSDLNQKFISPTLIDEPSLDSAIMTEEIFGPLLPILTFEDINDVINFVNQRPKPLALYVFTKSNKFSKQIIAQTSSGGVCVNDTISHITTSYLPFGGVGDSGMGQYHGKKGFESFSHYKSIMKKSQLIDFPLRYPPYMKLNKWILKVMKWIN